MRPRRSLRASLKWAFVMNLGQRGLATAFTFVLAAILGPEDFGLIAMGLAFVALIQVVLEQGISTAIVQREKLDDRYLDVAFWLNLAWCVVLAAVSVALSGWWAAANDTPELQDVILALSGLLLIWGLMIVPMSLLQRDSRFKELAAVWNVAALAGGVAGVALALAGAGVWAFVAQQLVMEGVAVVAMLAVVRWRPRLRFSRSHARELLGFSSSVFLANLGGFVNRRADTLLMGLFFGPLAVGLYRLADRIVDLVLEFTMRPIGVIALPHFSRLQSDPEGLRDSVEKCLRLTLLAAVPALVVVAATSDFVIALFGDEWAPAATVLPAALRRRPRQGARLLHRAAALRGLEAAPARRRALGARPAQRGHGRPGRGGAHERIDRRPDLRHGRVAGGAVRARHPAAEPGHPPSLRRAPPAAADPRASGPARLRSRGGGGRDRARRLGRIGRDGGDPGRRDRGRAHGSSCRRGARRARARGARRAPRAPLAAHR